MVATDSSSETERGRSSQPSPPESGQRGYVLLPGSLRGQQVGPYRLLDRLGGGAMAVVYRAVDERTDSMVALKVLLPDADDVMRSRFRQEARTHSSLHHPHIVPILDIGEDPHSGLTYIAMELLDGPTLSDVLEDAQRLSPEDAARILAPVADALDYANRQGVVHRDVKPSNVLLRRAQPGEADVVTIEGLDQPVIPLLSDFGIARALDAPDLTSMGRTIGTPTYMSPEQCADSHEIDGRSDLYSLGAVFYRCIIGRPPFGGSTTQILHAHVYDALTVPVELLAQLPRLAVTILQRSLAKEPGQRYASGAAMAADLRELAAQPVRSQVSVEATTTMPSLPTVRSATPPTVLIEAPALAAPAQTTGAGQESVRLETAFRAAGPPARSLRRRWAAGIAAALLALLFLIGASALIARLWPRDLIGQAAGTAAPAQPAGDTNSAVAAVDRPTSTAAVTATPVAPAVGIAASSTPPAATPAATVSPAAAVSPAAGSARFVTPAAASVVALATTAVPPATPTVLPTPSGPITGYWDMAQLAYQDHDWQPALDALTLVRRIDRSFQSTAADQMLFDIDVGLAARSIALRDFTQALVYLQDAVKLKPDAGQVAAIARSVAALTNPAPLNEMLTRWTLSTQLMGYGKAMLDAGNACAAVEQLSAAATMLPDGDGSRLLAESQARCAQADRDAAIRKQLADLGGSLIYSTQDGERYRIYAAPAKLDASSVLMIDDGAQPARQPGGSMLGFHSTRNGEQGLWLYDLAAGLSPEDRTRRVTNNIEDAHDAPPGWDRSGQRLVYSSSAPGDRRPHIFVADPAGGTPIDLGLGKDPAWSPVQDRIVFNGFAPTGGQPGLWVMRSDGSGRFQLTDNGNDIRPSWSPDGSSVVFMSNRDGNWEVYRVSLADGAITRLTDDLAQDGLPVVSPDGKWVAFASDRGGFWRVWVAPLDGGEPLPLFALNGVLTNWLEHAIQWLP